MQTVMKKCSAAILLAIALCLGLAMPQQALADAADPTATVELKAAGANATDVYLTTNQADARTFSVALQVKTDTPAYVEAEFTWDKAIQGENGSAASLLWAEPTRTASGMNVTLYAADLANEPFKDGGNVKLGTLKLTPSSSVPADQNVTATVQLMPGEGAVAFAAYRDAEQVVAEPTVKVADSDKDFIELTVHEADGKKDPTPTPEDPKRSPDILGETPDTGGQPLATTGDQMLPVIITLVCVAVLAFGVIAVAMLRRKRNEQTADEK